jgi:hypothetical protein
MQMETRKQREKWGGGSGRGKIKHFAKLSYLSMSRFFFEF